MKIDFVLTWVDDSDNEWLKEKNYYSNKINNNLTEEHGGNIRFRDWGLLKYWFRGVEKFAPWVNKIHFVTYGHLPKWLNTDHPKLNIVKHEDFIDNEYLPTFNSGTIELFLHKIPNLEDMFVYFNDDTFIIDTITPEMMFKNNLPVDEGIFGNVFLPDPNSTYEYGYLYMTGVINSYFNFKDTIVKNKEKYINKSYGDQLFNNEYFIRKSLFPGLYNHHLPQNFLKSTFEEMWETCESVLKDSAIEKFRTNKLISQYFVRFWQVMNGNFYPELYRKMGRSFGNPEKELVEIVNFLKNRERKFIVINDSIYIKNINKIIKKINNEFQILFPIKSSFEKEEY